MPRRAITIGAGSIVLQIAIERVGQGSANYANVLKEAAWAKLRELGIDPESLG
jgi:hypothetical protein